MSAEVPRVPRVWAGAVFSPGRFGIVHPNLPWRDVMEAYYWDNLSLALGLAEDVGMGFDASYLGVYNMIEAEAATREQSELSDRGDWLLIEHVPSATHLDVTDIETAVRSACDVVVQEFHWQHGPAVLVTILHPGADAPFIPGRHGFFMDKYPYDKICLPTSLLKDPDEFASGVRHEYAHAMALNRTQGLCPIWLHEAIAAVAEGRIHERPHGPMHWREPRKLNIAFRADRESEEGAKAVSAAYVQCRMIGAFLYDIGGAAKLGSLMDGFASGTFLEGLWQRVTSHTPEEDALQRVYGFGIQALRPGPEAGLVDE